MNIASLLKGYAQTRQEEIAIIDGHFSSPRKTSFAQMEHDVSRFANLLREQGCKRGDHVLIFQTMSMELYVVLLAVFRLGMVAMFVDPSQGRSHLERCCQRVPPKALIASSKAQLLRLISNELRRIPIKITLGIWMPWTVNYKKLQHQNPLAEIVNCDADTPALITFTSGSTGMPKAAVRTHGFLQAQHRVLADNLQHQAQQIDLVTLPIFVLANLASGLTSLIADVDFRSPGSIDAAIVVKQFTGYPSIRTAASPAFYERLVNYCYQHAIKLENVTRIDTGGAPVFPALLQQLHAIAPNAKIVAIYGSTEAEPIAHIHWSDVTKQDRLHMIEGKGLLAGLPVSQIDCRIIGDQFGTGIGPFTQQEFSQQLCKPWVIGEIVVAGEHVLPGYLDGQGDEETKFRVNDRPWHRTGDCGYFDELGRLWLVGRSIACIHDSQGSLYPFTVEAVARMHIEIARAAMFAMNGRRILVIQFNPGMEINIAMLKQELKWACLDEVCVLKYIPVDKRHNAKIDYTKLKKLLGK